MSRAFEKGGLRLLFDRDGVAAGVAREAADFDLDHKHHEGDEWRRDRLPSASPRYGFSIHFFRVIRSKFSLLGGP
jgi:hypothetical protein